jgi:RecJ-like exonuclease
VTEAERLREKIRAGDFDWRDILRVYQLERGTDDVKMVRACPVCNGVGRIRGGEKCPLCGGKGTP